MRTDSTAKSERPLFIRAVENCRHARQKRVQACVKKSMTRVVLSALLMVSLICGLFSSSLLAQDYPRPWGYVSDFADVISEDYERQMVAIAREVEQKTSAEISVVTIHTTGGVEIHDYSVGLFTDWQIGKAGKDNGILIIAAINDKQLWIKTGYGLEHVIPDAVASRIYRDVLRPAFRSREYGWGMLSAVRIIASRIAESEGATLDSIDSLVVVPQTRIVDTGSRPLIPFLVFFFIATLVTILRVAGSRGSRRHGGFPFWTIGGFSGGTRGGSFGGGFGGFGGGSCGGGGAGGGW